MIIAMISITQTEHPSGSVHLSLDSRNTAPGMTRKITKRNKMSKKSILFDLGQN